MNKKIAALVLLVSSLLMHSQAQRTPQNMPKYDYKLFHFGYVIGYNHANFAIRPKSNLNTFDSLMRLESTGMSGFDIGIVTNLRLGSYFDLRFLPSISLIDRKVDYQMVYNGNELAWVSKNVESVNLNFPLLIKLKSSRMGNFRFYAIFGGEYSFDMATRSKKRNPVNETVLKLIPHDFHVHAGTGLDFYLESFKLALEFKMSYGVINILKQESNMFSYSLERLSTKTFQFSILFE